MRGRGGYVQSIRVSIKAGSQYILYPLRRNRKSLIFQWAWTRRYVRLEFLSIPASLPIEKIMTSGRDATGTIYCEPALTNHLIP